MIGVSIGTDFRHLAMMSRPMVTVNPGASCSVATCHSPGLVAAACATRRMAAAAAVLRVARRRFQ